MMCLFYVRVVIAEDNFASRKLGCCCFFGVNRHQSAYLGTRDNVNFYLKTGVRFSKDFLYVRMTSNIMAFLNSKKDARRISNVSKFRHNRKLAKRFI